MSYQYNQTGDFGRAVYGAAGGQQHIATAPAVMAGGKRRSRRQNKSDKKQRGGKRQRQSQRQSQRKSRRDRRSRRQRGGK